MSTLVVPSDITNRLARLNAELTRRNGYTNLSVNAPITLTVTQNTLITVSAINTLFSGLRLINGTTVPADRVALTSQLLESDLTFIDNLLTTFEARPRGERTTNDCAAACSGTCISQCTTGCTGCSGCSGCGSGCASGCASPQASCYGGCLSGCKSACALACATSCAGTCRGKSTGATSV